VSPDKEPNAKGWWQTLPGVLTAGAAIITAITGLLVAVHQAGFLGRSPQAPAQIQSKAQPAGDSPHPADTQNAVSPLPTSVTSPQTLALPESTRVRSGDYVYQLLSARLEPYSPGKVALHLSIRMTNNDRFPANFWSDSFRLLVDGALQAPTNSLNELLPSKSSKDGNVEFVISASVSTAGLQMGDVGDGKPTMAINLRSSQR
jgi:hypothetical protein